MNIGNGRARRGLELAELLGGGDADEFAHAGRDRGIR